MTTITALDMDDNENRRYSNEDVLEAVRRVITFTICDVFALTEAERHWVSYKVKNALAPYSDRPWGVLPHAVKCELDSGDYTRKLNDMNGHALPEPEEANGVTKTAGPQEWAQALGDIATKTFQARQITDFAFIGTIAGILAELGVGDEDSPRGSTYLPTSVRALLGG